MELGAGFSQCVAYPLLALLLDLTSDDFCLVCCHSLACAPFNNEH